MPRGTTTTTTTTRRFDPEADLEECVAIDPGDAEAWRILADVSRRGATAERTFLRLRKAQASAPHDAKIAREVFAAARAVKAEADGGTYEGARGVGGAMDRRPGSLYKILGVAAAGDGGEADSSRVPQSRGKVAPR